MKFEVYFLIFFLGVGVAAHGGESEDAAFKAALAAAKQQALSMTAKVAIDRVYKGAVGSAVVIPKTGQTSGGAAVAAFGVVLGIDELGKAKNDNQKLYGAADTVVAGVSFVFPPAGAVAAICVAATKIVDGILSAQSAAVVLRYRELEFQYLTEYVKILQRIAAADNVALQRYVNAYKAAEVAYDSARAKANSDCQNVDKNHNLKDIDQCLAATGDAINLLLIQTNALDGFLSQIEKSNGVKAIFEQNHLDFSSLRTTNDSLKRDYSAKKSALDDAYKKFVSASTQFMLDQIRTKHMTAPIVTAMYECNSVLDGKTLKMALALGILRSQWSMVARVDENAGLGVKFGQLDIESLADEADQVYAGPCFEMTQNDIASASNVAQIMGKNFLAGRDQFVQTLGLLHSELEKLP